MSSSHAASLATALPADGLAPDSIHAPSPLNGDLPEKTIGDPATAKVVLYEYADYACPHCAEWSAIIDRMVADSHGALAVVYRGYLLGFKNSVVSASAATAAQLQGCWQAYKDLLFMNQSTWASLSGDALESELVACFEKASGGQGDIAKFKADMQSEAVAQKIAFEHRLGTEARISGTPAFRLDGQPINLKDLPATVAAKLATV